MASIAGSYPRLISKNLLHPSAFVSYSRFVAFFIGCLYGTMKVKYLDGYVHSEDHKKAEQLMEADIKANTLRGISFHGPQVYDPEFTEGQLKFRDYYPDYFLHPNDEFVYQVTRSRQREQQSYVNKTYKHIYYYYILL